MSGGSSQFKQTMGYPLPELMVVTMCVKRISDTCIALGDGGGWESDCGDFYAFVCK
jgi:hypothetical protein